jgi:peptidoglycan/LPS O-acetylase OafA/YrhL
MKVEINSSQQLVRTGGLSSRHAVTPGGPMTVDASRAAKSNPPRQLVFHMARRDDLQGMRAVAVLAVFADHLFNWPSGGFVGVDMFFVLSGFFITGLLLKERSTTGELSFRNFYTRRVKRILPSALLVLLVTVVAAQFLFPATRAKETLLDGLWAALFAANFRFQAVGADYFQQALPPSPIQHYWSLSIEEQFYFVWPALLLVLFLVTRKMYLRGKVWTRQWGLFLCMALIVGGSFAWAMILTGSDPNAAYFSTFTRVWELGVGALLAIGGPWLARIPEAARPWIAYVGLVGVVASLFVISSESRFPAPWAALPVLSTAVVVASFHGGEVRWSPLTNPVARWFGDTSYTLYLWHWPVIILLLSVMPDRGPTFYAIAVVLALGLTAVTFHFYEDPIRKSQWLLGKRRSGRARFLHVDPSAWAMVGAVTAMAMLASILYIQRTDDMAANQAEVESATIVNLAAPPALALPTPPGTDAPPLSVVPGNDPCFGAPALINPSCKLRDPAVELKPSVENFATEIGGPFCFTREHDPLMSCNYGYQGDDATRIALVGDSHAGRVLHGLAPYLEASKWNLTTYFGQGCVFKRPTSDDCSAMPEIQKQLTSQKFDVVLSASTRAGNPGEYVAAWKPLIAAGSRVVVLADNPKASEESIACVSRVTLGKDRTGECGTPKPRAMQPDPQVQAARNSTPPIPVIDLTSYYCKDDTCPSVIGNVIVYADTSSHLTPTYTETIAPALVSGLQQIISDKQPAG